MDSIFIDYDDSLIGRRPIDIDTFYGAGPGGMNERRAVACVKYMLEKVLVWTPETAIQRFDRYYISLMKLDRIVQFIEYPVEIPSGDPRYILSLVYPDKITVTRESMTKEAYNEVLKLEGRQFPREYFSGSRGFFRFCSCLKHLVENYHPVKDLDELYGFISGRRGVTFLAKYRLKVPAEQFSISILDVLKYITRDDPDSELYYCYYSYLNGLQRLRRGYLEKARGGVPPQDDGDGDDDD